MSILFRFPFAVVLALAASTAALAQAVVFPPGSGVGLAPPAGMVSSTSFAGFEHRATGSSVLTLDMPVQAYAEILAGFTPEGLAPTGFLAGAPAVDWKIVGGEGRLLRGKQTARGVVYRKWVVLAKSSAATAMISVQAPESQAKELTDTAIEGALRTISLRALPSFDEQIAALPFSLGDRAGFRVIRTLAGSGVLLTEGPQDTVTDASQPVVTIASGLGAAIEPAGRSAFARQAYSTVGGASDVTIDAETTSTSGDTVRIEGRGVYRSSAEAVYVLQVVRFSPTGYVRTVAVSRTLDKARYGGRFDRIADSVRPK